eukprot:6055110-Amphidinium_carterae.1
MCVTGGAGGDDIGGTPALRVNVQRADLFSAKCSPRGCAYIAVPHACEDMVCEKVPSDHHFVQNTPGRQHIEHTATQSPRL